MHNNVLRILVDKTSCFAAAVSTSDDTQQAARDVCARATTALCASPHLALVFASADHQPRFDVVAEVLTGELGGACVLGCTGESIVAGEREFENSSALALWVAHLPDVTLSPMHLEFVPTPDGGSFTGWPGDPAHQWPTDASLLVLGDPFSFPADVLLARLNEDRPGVRVFGGMSSGAWGPGQNRLLVGSRVENHGAAAVLVHGDVTLTSVVSQGCRPIGRPLVVTRAERNVIFELGGRAAVSQLQDIYSELSDDDERLIQQGLHVGIVIDEYRESFARGDFLIRNVEGFDPNLGAIVIGDFARTGQTVQFHVRDASTADEDLDALISTAHDGPAAGARGALVFTCNGRGTRLFDAPHHDAAKLARYWPGLPAAGFFAAGEIGPIGPRNFLHGFTASVVLWS
jgi:small ligand-binding sensory domain FIST